MKRRPVVLAVSIVNVAIVALAAFVIRAAAQAPALPAPQFRAARAAWQSAACADVLPSWGEVSLSPTKRPITETNTTTTTVEKEPTQDELRAEMEAKLRREVKLLRIMCAEGRPDLCFAKVRIGTQEIVLAPNSAVYAATAPALVKTLPAWLADVQVKEITADGVKLDVPLGKPGLRFEYTLTLRDNGLITVTPRG